MNDTQLFNPHEHKQCEKIQIPDLNLAFVTQHRTILLKNRFLYVLGGLEKKKPTVPGIKSKGRTPRLTKKQKKRKAKAEKARQKARDAETILGKNKC